MLTDTIHFPTGNQLANEWGILKFMWNWDETTRNTDIWRVADSFAAMDTGMEISCIIYFQGILEPNRYCSQNLDSISGFFSNYYTVLLKNYKNDEMEDTWYWPFQRSVAIKNLGGYRSNNGYIPTTEVFRRKCEKLNIICMIRWLCTVPSKFHSNHHFPHLIVHLRVHCSFALRNIPSE